MFITEKARNSLNQNRISIHLGYMHCPVSHKCWLSAGWTDIKAFQADYFLFKVPSPSLLRSRFVLFLILYEASSFEMQNINGLSCLAQTELILNPVNIHTPADKVFYYITKWLFELCHLRVLCLLFPTNCSVKCFRNFLRMR